MSLDTLTTLRQRVNYLIGDTSATTSGIIDSHINAAIRDIVNSYPFSWNITSATGSLATSGSYYAFNLAADYNPKWHLADARIVNSGVANDYIFTEVVQQDIDLYPLQTYKYWLGYDTTNKVYVFTTPESSGSVVYRYNFLPATLGSGTDTCIIPDTEAVCYLAASKNWLTDERNEQLTLLYKQEASSRIQSMWQTDNAYGPVPVEGSIIDDNPYLLRR